MLSLEEGRAVLAPLATYVLGIVVYSVFIFKFYLFAARKDTFSIDLKKYNKAKHPVIKKTVGLVMHAVKYVLLFPVFTVFWFTVLAFFLSLLAKNQNLEAVLLISMAVVSAVRITAYYNEDLSKDLAKMLPFALLGVFIIDISYFDSLQATTVLSQLPNQWTVVFYYLIFVILLEFILRVLYGLVALLRKKTT